MTGATMMVPMVPVSFQPGELPCPELAIPELEASLDRASDSTDVQLPHAWDDDELEVSLELD